MFRVLIRYNDPDLVTKLMADLKPMFRTWIMHEAERIGRMPLLDPGDKARLFNEVHKKLGRVDPRTGDLAKRLILLLILTEAAKERGRDQPGHTGSPDLAREIQAEQNAIHTVARIHEQLYDAALGILENIKG